VGPASERVVLGVGGVCCSGDGEGPSLGSEVIDVVSPYILSICRIHTSGVFSVSVIRET